MSTIQSHTITEAENSFDFPQQPRLTQMNTRSDLLRQQSMPQLPPQMLSLNAPQFLSTQQQPGQQQQHMGLLPTANNSNAPMGILGPAQSNNLSQRFELQLQQANQQQRRNNFLMQQSQNPQALGSPGASSTSHLAGLSHSQLQSMGFPGGIMQQPANTVGVRRVASQPQPLNQSSAHLGMQPGATGMNMGMNPQTSMPGQLRQAQQQHSHQQMNLRLQQHQQLQGHMPPEMAMALRNTNLSQGVARTASAQAQLLGNLSQPPALSQPHVGGIQASHHQNNFQNSITHQQPQISSSPRPGSHSQTHTPSNISMTNQGPPQATVNRTQITPDSGMFMSFQNPPFPQTPHTSARLPSNNGQFPFVPSSTPPIQHGDIPQSISGGLVGSGSRGGFQMTPAQQYEQMQPTGETYGSHFNISPPQSNVPPPRPPSHNNHPPGPLPPQQQQSQQQDHMAHLSLPQRPQSQPSTQPGIPQPQSDPTHTPRVSQPQLPTNPLSSGRIPALPQSQSGGPQSHQPQLGSLPINSRASLSAASGSSSSTVSSSVPPSSEVASLQGQINTRNREIFGQGLIRLLQFSGLLASETGTKLQLSYWDALVHEYFTPKAIMKFTLWKDNQRNEAKPFEIGVPILPRFFLVTTQSGVKSMTLSLDGARERLYASGHVVVECVAAVWTYKYGNGYTVTLRGPLTAHVVVVPGNTSTTQSTPQQLPYSLKFDNFQFDANRHDKYIALESILGHRMMESPGVRNVPVPTVTGIMDQRREEDKKWEEPRVTIECASIPGEPVNAFGIPQATMRCLELAESVGQMADLISFANETKLGPLDALSKFAARLRGSQWLNPNQGPLATYVGDSFQSFPTVNALSATPAVTLFSTAPSSTISSASSQTAPSVSPQNVPQPAETSQKQSKSATQQAPTPTSGPVPTSAPGSSGPNTTPSMSNASLKRKQTSETSSPTTANAEQAPAKRVTRKRGRTTGGG